MFSFSVIVAFILGAVAVVAAEMLALYWLLRRLTARKRGKEEDGKRDLAADQQPLVFPYHKQGSIWVLEQDKFIKNLQYDPQLKGSKEQKKNRDFFEVSPVKKKAEIKDRCLVLKDLDGSQTVIIQLLGCEIVAISGSQTSSRKWVRKYPIKVENKGKNIYNGSKVFYMYLETSWEKESWCKALRLVSCSDMEKMHWYTQLSKEFHCYLTSLTSEHPLFPKRSAVSSETTDKINKMDGSSSKVRHFFKKIARKASKLGSESKASTMSSFNKMERKVGDKNHQHTMSTNRSTKSFSTEKPYLQDTSQSTSTSSALLGSQHVPPSVGGLDEKRDFDEGAICLNLLLSRLFFDTKKSTELNDLIKERIQGTHKYEDTKLFSGLTCIGLKLGSRPPYLHSMRAVPIDMKEAWAMEVDIEYSGGFLLEIETRLEVREPELQRNIVGNVEPTTAGDVTSDILESLKCYNQDMNTSNDLDDIGGLDDEIKPDNGDFPRQSKSGSWTSSYKSRWKTLLTSVADHVSQVPISLEASVASLRGTLLLQVKPPPSDQLWISFISMPEIEFSFNSAIGDHKIASTHLALLIGSRFKAAIRGSLVLPNCESVCIPWMLADKDDWLPRNAAPFLWIRQESAEFPGNDASKTQHIESKTKADIHKENKTNTAEEKVTNVSASLSLVEPVLDHASSCPTPFLSNDPSTTDIVPEAPKVPLGNEDDTLENANLCRTEHPSLLSIVPASVHNAKTQEDAKSRKIGKRELMKDLGKKMSEKFDGKIRQASKHFVENDSTDIETVEVSDIVDEATNKNIIEYGENEDMTTKKAGKKEMIMDLGKKMNEKLEEKMRQIEEMGRHAVDSASTDIGQRASTASADDTASNSSMEDLKVPLLTNDNTQVNGEQVRVMSPKIPLASTRSLQEQTSKHSEEDMKIRKIWRKDRVWDLGKKMSEKFDEKRRHIEEKGRNIVEKMKENSRTSDGSGNASFSKNTPQKTNSLS